MARGPCRARAMPGDRAAPRKALPVLPELLKRTERQTGAVNSLQDLERLRGSWCELVLSSTWAGGIKPSSGWGALGSILACQPSLVATKVNSMSDQMRAVQGHQAAAAMAVVSMCPSGSWT